MNRLWIGGDGPGGIPQWAYIHLVTILNIAPDNLTRLRSVQQMNYNGNVLVNLIRIFDPGLTEEIINVRDFTSLDDHPNLILYEGYLEEGSRKVYLAPGIAAQQSSQSPLP